MTNEEIMKTLKSLEGGKSDDMIARIELLKESGRFLSHEKAMQIGGLLYALSTAFANGAVMFTESVIPKALSKNYVTHEDGELAQILLRQMFSARDDESKGKENYVQLQSLLRVIYYPNTDFDGDFQAVLTTGIGKEYESVKTLRRKITAYLSTRRRGAVMCVLIEYYTPMLMAMLSYAFNSGLTPDQKKIKEVYRANKQRDKKATLYLDNHGKSKSRHLGYHVFRSLLQKNEHYLLKEITSECIELFTDVITDFEKLLIVRTGKGKDKF